VATPETIKRYGHAGKAGRPGEAALHRRHQCAAAEQLGAEIGGRHATQAVTVSGPIEVNSPLSTRAAVLANLGFGLAPDFIVREDLKSGALVEVLPASTPDEPASTWSIRTGVTCRPRCALWSTFLAEWFKAYEARAS
jgi:DNA-binding transcriptional LysR family regulator